MALQFVVVENEEEPPFVLAEGECPICTIPNSLIITQTKLITKSKAKIFLSCMCCNRKFQNVMEKGPNYG